MDDDKHHVYRSVRADHLDVERADLLFNFVPASISLPKSRLENLLTNAVAMHVERVGGRQTHVCK